VTGAAPTTAACAALLMQRRCWTAHLIDALAQPINIRSRPTSRYRWYRWLPPQPRHARGQPRNSNITAGMKTITNSNCPISTPTLNLRGHAPAPSRQPEFAKCGGRSEAVHKAETKAPHPPSPVGLGREKIFERDPDKRSRNRQRVCPMPSLRRANQPVATVRSISTLAGLDSSPNMTCRSPLPDPIHEPKRKPSREPHQGVAPVAPIPPRGKPATDLRRVSHSATADRIVIPKEMPNTEGPLLTRMLSRGEARPNCAGPACVSPPPES
jgi:hypothetical protein